MSGTEGPRPGTPVGGTQVYDVDVVAVPAQAWLCLALVDAGADGAALVARLHEIAARAGLLADGPPATRFAPDSGAVPAVATEVAIPVRPFADGSLPTAVEEARGEWIPLHHALQAVHVGRRADSAGAHAAVREACSALGYTPAGPITEICETRGPDGAAAGATTTRVRMPYAR